MIKVVFCAGYNELPAIIQKNMSKNYRLSFLGISLIILVILGRFLTGNYNFLLDDFWFTSGLLLLILLSLIDQPHFSKDSNIFINAITAGISLLIVQKENRDFIFWIFLVKNLVRPNAVFI